MLRDKKSFGRELEAVLGFVNGSSVLAEQSLKLTDLQQVLLSELIPGRFQPRRNFDESMLQELASSIKSQGVLQPLLVRKHGEKYEIIAGERRWRAARIAGMANVPVVVCGVADEAALAFGLIENIQRQNLNCIEEAEAINRLLNEFSMTHEKVAEVVGKSRAMITNLLRLLSLSKDVKEMVINGKLEMGHARAILSLTEEEQCLLAEKVVKNGLSVREVEKLVQNINGDFSWKGKYVAQKSREIDELERMLSEKLDVNVKIKTGKLGSGKLVVSFDSIKKLYWICERL